MATPVIERLAVPEGAPYSKCQCVVCGTVFNAAIDAQNPVCPNASKHVEAKVTTFQLLNHSRETLMATYIVLTARKNPEDVGLLAGIREAISQFGYDVPR